MPPSLLSEQREHLAKDQKETGGFPVLNKTDLTSLLKWIKVSRYSEGIDRGKFQVLHAIIMYKWFEKKKKIVLSKLLPYLNVSLA